MVGEFVPSMSVYLRTLQYDRHASELNRTLCNTNTKKLVFYGQSLAGTTANFTLPRALQQQHNIASQYKPYAER